MANFKSVDEVWSPRYKQDIINYVNHLEQELNRLSRGSTQKRRTETGKFESKTGNSKLQNVRTAYKLYYKEQMSKAQIARILMVSESTVSRYLTLAREELNARAGAYSKQARESNEKNRIAGRPNRSTGVGNI